MREGELPIRAGYGPTSVYTRKAGKSGTVQAILSNVWVSIPPGPLGAIWPWEKTDQVNDRHRIVHQTRNDTEASRAQNWLCPIP